MTKLLLNPDNPKGWNLEDIIDEIQNDIVLRSVRIVEDGRPEARAVLTNNIEIMKLLTVCSEKAYDSTRVLSALGPSQGPQGVPRIGAPARSSATASESGVCPPNWTIRPSGFSLSTIANTSSSVSGSK